MGLTNRFLPELLNFNKNHVKKLEWLIAALLWSMAITKSLENPDSKFEIICNTRESLKIEIHAYKTYQAILSKVSI